MQGNDFVWLSDEDGLGHIDSLLTAKCTAKDRETLGFEDYGVKRLLLFNCVLSTDN